MDERVREKLGVLIQRYSDSVEEEPQRIISALRDYCATSKEEIHVLDVAVKAGVLGNLLSSSADALGISPTIKRCTQKVVAFGVSESKARWAVEAWALALGRISEGDLSPFISEKEEKFREAIEATLADKILTPEEKSYLLVRARNFDISEAEAEHIISDILSQAGVKEVSTKQTQWPSIKSAEAPEVSPTPPFQYPTPPAPSITPPKVVSFWTTGKKNILILFIILGISFTIYSIFLAQSSFTKKIDGALKKGNYFSPSGDNVEEIYKSQLAKSPNSQKLKDAAKRIYVIFTKEGEAAFQRLYADSDDSGWDGIAKMYSFLSEIIPDDKEIMARAEFSEAHNILKSGNVNDFSEALKHYHKALELKPNWVFPINGIAKVYILKTSQYYNKDEALVWYNRVCEVDPNFPWAYSNIAAIRSEELQWALAEQALLKAVKIKSNRPSFYIDLGNICEKQQKQVEAKNYFQEALKYEKNSERILWLQKKLSSIK
jgi:tetratricopeptide (TPR) repeat protein